MTPCLMRSNPQRLLVSHIEEHLHSLEKMRGPLQAEVEVNAAHGAALELLVQERCLPVEAERYSLFIGDLEKVVNLLLCLSARLARVQNALSTVDQHTDAEEKVSHREDRGTRSHSRYLEEDFFFFFLCILKVTSVKQP